jgi:hypothetical protein
MSLFMLTTDSEMLRCDLRKSTPTDNVFIIWITFAIFSTDVWTLPAGFVRLTAGRIYAILYIHFV